MSIFNPNYKLLNKYLTEAETEEEDDYSIDDKEFDVDDEDDKENNSKADKAADDLINGDDTPEETDSKADKAADDLINGSEENNTSNDSNEETNNDGNDQNDNNSESQDTDDFDINLDDDTNNDEGGQDNQDGNNSDSQDSDDFDINMDGDDSGDNGSEDSGGDSDGDSSSESDDITNELVDKEKEIFSDLTEKQMKIKVKELKESYTTFLSVIEDINSRITAIPKNSNNIKILKFISSKLLDLKSIVNDYLIDTFDTKTYIENVIFYQTNLSQLNTIKKVLEEMTPKDKIKTIRNVKK